ncbi:MAG: hypothetical protein BWY95_01930 [Bacteroidetes bacterium ADurb.BinA104]|nr:MAG: hypothetical protein BWY95_01930 [Bacteroidetes bacterium ADurb.BinA104]
MGVIFFAQTVDYIIGTGLVTAVEVLGNLNKRVCGT